MARRPRLRAFVATPRPSNRLHPTVTEFLDPTATCGSVRSRGYAENECTYDHVPPPAAVPPHTSDTPGQYGFTFNRSGVRIPTLAISAWVPERTVVTDHYRATSLLATMRERWNLGAPFTARDGAPRGNSRSTQSSAPASRLRPSRRVGGVSPRAGSMDGRLSGRAAQARPSGREESAQADRPKEYPGEVRSES
jgi:Phosphoesterase family